MIPAEDVKHVYRALLGREPESDAVIETHSRGPGGLSQLIRNILGSPEYLGRPAPSTSSDGRFDGVNSGDHELLHRHLAPAEPEPGFVKNFLGVRMRVAYVDALSVADGMSYRQIPTIQQDYHAEAIEFIGTLRAIEAGSGPFVVVELGAGWGSWSIIAGVVARRLGRGPVKLYAVEGSAGKVENMKTHFRDNGFDPDEHVIVHAAIGPRDGFALFPQVNVTADWGAVALFSDVETEREGYDVVRSVSLEHLLADEPFVDLIHFDVQGAEGEVIPTAVDLLTQKVRYLVVGTHSRAIEGKIIDALLPRGWTLENEQPAQIGHSDHGKEALYADGTQVWRNTAF